MAPCFSAFRAGVVIIQHQQLSPPLGLDLAPWCAGDHHQAALGCPQHRMLSHPQPARAPPTARTHDTSRVRDQNATHQLTVGTSTSTSCRRAIVLLITYLKVVNSATLGSKMVTSRCVLVVDAYRARHAHVSTAKYSDLFVCHLVRLPRITNGGGRARGYYSMEIPVRSQGCEFIKILTRFRSVKSRTHYITHSVRGPTHMTPHQ